MRLTVGPLPPAVYWRRRALVLGAILLVLFLVAQACMAASANPDRSAGESTGSPTPPASPSQPSPVTPEPEEPAGEPEGEDAGEPSGEELPPGGSGVDLGEAGCTDDEMLVRASAEPTTFAAGGRVRVALLIENDSDRACQRDVGGALREIYLRRSSGADRIWSSRDCADLEGQDVQELAPGMQLEYYVDWNGRASDDCGQGEAAGELVEPGEYELVARLGTVYSEEVVVTVTAGS